MKEVKKMHKISRILYLVAREVHRKLRKPTIKCNVHNNIEKPKHSPLQIITLISTTM